MGKFSRAFSLTILLSTYSVAEELQFPLAMDADEWRSKTIQGIVWNNSMRGYHLGDDIGVPAEVEVRAIAQGIVKHAAYHPGPPKKKFRNYGGMYIIEHPLTNGDTVCAVYAHLDFTSFPPEVLKEGKVKKGQYIGKIGNYNQNGGWGEHLHFGIRKGAYSKKKIYMHKPKGDSWVWAWDWVYPGYTRNAKLQESKKTDYDVTHEMMKNDWHDPLTFIEFYNSHGYPPGGSPTVGLVVKLNHDFAPGSYHKEADSPTVYLAYKDDRLWPIFSGEVLFALTGKPNDYSMVVSHPAGSLKAYRKGQTVGKVGSLYKISAAPDVYLVAVDEQSQNTSGQIMLGVIRPIRDGGTFILAGFGWENILEVEESFLRRYIKGELFTPSDIADAYDPIQFRLAITGGTEGEPLYEPDSPEVGGPESLRIIDYFPGPNTADAYISTPIQITFSEAMLPTPTESAFSLTKSGRGIFGSFHWSDFGDILTFTPANALEYNTTYVVRVAGTAQDVYGRGFTEDSWSFTTETTPSTGPSGGAGNPEPLPPEIKVDVSSLDFGEVEVGEKAILSFWVKNPGKGTLEIMLDFPFAPYLPQFWTSPAPSSQRFSVSANDSQRVEVYFTPTSTLPISGTLILSHNVGGVDDPRVSLSGRGKRSVPRQIIIISDTLTNGAVIESVLIKAGQVLMGAAPDDPYIQNIGLERPQQLVTITKDFGLGIYEVTEGWWQAIAGNVPLTWNNVQNIFLPRINALAGGKVVYRMPTEAEWELGAGDGSTYRWFFGNDTGLLRQYAYAAENPNSQAWPEQVGRKQPSPNGLYDIYGNRAEMTRAIGGYETRRYTDPPGSSDCMLRGGSWQDDFATASSVSRRLFGPNDVDRNVSFRLARIVLPAKISVANSLDFGAVKVGESDTLTLTITNSGDATLELSSITSDNKAFKVLSNWLHVPGHENRQISIVFTPTSIGGTSANLSLTHNVADGLSIVSLSGAATDVAQPIKVSTGQVSGTIGKEVLIPVRIGRVVLPDTTGDDVIGAKITETRAMVRFDPTQLDFTELNLNPDNVLTSAGHTVSFHQAPGLVTVGSTGTTPLPHKGTLFWMRFSILSGSHGDHLPIMFQAVELRARTSSDPSDLGYLLSVEPIAGAVNIVTLRGDVNHNGSITAFDAILILRYLVGLEQGNALSLPPNARDFSLATADVNQDGRISPLDAAFIFQLDAGIISTFPSASSKRIASGERRITIADPQYSSEETILLPVTLDDLSGVLAGEMTLSYDPALFEIIKVTPAEALTGWQVASQAQAGQLRIAFAGATCGTGAGDLLLVELRPLNNQSIVGNPLVITKVILNDGAIKTVVQPNLPKTYTLFQNIPNPFNPVTQIRFDLPQAGYVSLLVYNLAGQVVQTLVNEERSVGCHSIIWDGRDEYGREVASGIYLYRLTAGAFTATKKMVVMK